MITVGAILTLLLFGCAMHGWGTLARRAAGLPAGTWPMTMAIGLAAWIAIGGVLNLLHLAYPVVIWLLLASGCGILARTIFDRRLHIRSVLATGREEKLYWIAWLCLATVIIGFTIATQLSPSAYNHHDDYQKYFVHVARLLQTGTLRGSPLNTLGSETLGGQAFLQAAFVAYLQFSFINAADAVLCFSLMILLIGGIALRRPALAPVALSTMIAVWLFEPQYVNITSLYSAAALIFAVITLTVDRREYAAGNASCPPAAVVGLLYAALMALKPTFGPLIFLHISFCAVVEVVSSRRIGSAVKRSLAVASWGLLFLAPWLALYAPLYWIALTAPVVGTVEAPIPMIQTINLLATSTLFYGGSYAAYTLVALVPPICGAVAVAQRGWTDPDATRLGAACMALPVAYLFMLLTTGPLLAGYNTSLRHFLPVMIGVMPAALVLCGLFERTGPRPRLSLATVTAAGLAAILAVAFASDFWARARLLARTGTMLAYVRNWPSEGTSALLTASSEMLQPRGPLAHQLAELQQKVPAGEPLLVWSTAPFLLDFARNPIIDVDIGGVANPWSKTPPVSYVLWQRSGFGVRLPADYERQMRHAGRRETYLAARGLAYFQHLEHLASRAKVLVDDGSTVVLRIE